MDSYSSVGSLIEVWPNRPRFTGGAVPTPCSPVTLGKWFDLSGSAWLQSGIKAGDWAVDQESTIKILRRGLGGVAGLYPEPKDESDFSSFKTKDITSNLKITKAPQRASYPFQWTRKPLGVTNKTFGGAGRWKQTKPVASSPPILFDDVWAAGCTFPQSGEKPKTTFIDFILLAVQEIVQP